MTALSKWLEKLGKGPVVSQLRGTLAGEVAQPIWWEIDGPKPARLDYRQACQTCRFVRSSPANRRVCQRRFLQALAEAAQGGRPIQFVCPIQRYAIALPLLQGTQSQGYLALCHSERAFSPSAIALGQAALESAMREVERAEELKTLSEAIQPRCVALSTVHTIHRLISSTLNLEELLPRVAHLCCQVLRAQVCAIWLADREKQRFLLRALADLRKPKVSRKGFLRGRMDAKWAGRPSRLADRVASAGKVHFSAQRMVVPLVEEECLGVLWVEREKGKPSFGTLDQEILVTLAEQAVVAIRNAQMYETQERVTWGTIRSLSQILDGMDSSLPGRVSRRKLLAEVALAIAKELKVPEVQQKSIEYAALLHDAGRVGIPEEILHKPSKLEPAEFARIKEHPIRGASLLEPLEVLEPAIPIILHHHERFDGTGYPRGLKREAIPLGARILAVANAFEAMICERPYRRAMSVSEGAKEISAHSATQFDPRVVQAFLRLVRRGSLNRILAALMNSQRTHRHP